MYLTLLHNRSIIRLSGEDRLSFLQGLISQDVHACRTGQAIHAALLSPQGKFLHDMFVYDEGQAHLIDCETGRAEDLITRLKHYRLRTQIEIETAHDQYRVYALFNNDLDAPMEAPQRPDAITSADPRHPALGFRVILNKNTSPGFDAEPADFDAYDQHRLKLGIPDGSRDMLIEKSTLIEGNYDLLNGISWSKGCYVGQEVTARMHYRALAKKRLFPVTMEGESPAPGITLKFEDEEVGEMRSHAGPYGLALFNIEKAKYLLQHGIALPYAETKLTLHQPEWLKV